ncbi:hypothetical protein IQ266_17880 [filamentous cyanobacterium LEGE 11480]|uniref:Uncharacterized protein n=1 Tax=Romeriopsis navalis LEGE 11480 TaxID=2777977 RepID=A0A928Z3K3_9CYAN|nr:hypothetical protein [Romeriopsis navalis]MBE9031606.1 hypothetical protein [Romeriopsis navalis LEGE 11480]
MPAPSTVTRAPARLLNVSPAPPAGPLAVPSNNVVRVYPRPVSQPVTPSPPQATPSHTNPGTNTYRPSPRVKPKPSGGRSRGGSFDRPKPADPAPTVNRRPPGYDRPTPRPKPTNPGGGAGAGGAAAVFPLLGDAGNAVRPFLPAPIQNIPTPGDFLNPLSPYSPHNPMGPLFDWAPWNQPKNPNSLNPQPNWNVPYDLPLNQPVDLDPNVVYGFIAYSTNNRRGVRYINVISFQINEIGGPFIAILNFSFQFGDSVISSSINIDPATFRLFIEQESNPVDRQPADPDQLPPDLYTPQDDLPPQLFPQPQPPQGQPQLPPILGPLPAPNPVNPRQPQPAQPAPPRPEAEPAQPAQPRPEPRQPLPKDPYLPPGPQPVQPAPLNQPEQPQPPQLPPPLSQPPPPLPKVPPRPEPEIQLPPQPPLPPPQFDMCADPCISDMHDTLNDQKPVTIPYQAFTGCNAETNTPEFATLSLEVPENQALFMQTMLNKLAILEGQQCTTETEAYAALPDAHQIKLDHIPPQLVVQYAELFDDGKTGAPKYSISIPYYLLNESETTASLFPQYDKGQRIGVVTLSNNAKLIVNAKDEKEVDRVIDKLKILIDPNKRIGEVISNNVRKGQDLKEITVVPKIAKYFAGNKNEKPIWIKYL